LKNSFKIKVKKLVDKHQQSRYTNTVMKKNLFTFVAKAVFAIIPAEVAGIIAPAAHEDRESQIR